MPDASLAAIWIKTSHGGPMDPVTETRLIAGRGVDGSADSDGKRQVTLLAKEAWDRVMAGLGADVDPAARRANLLVTGVELAGTTGRTLRVGPCRIRIQGETTPCGLLDKALPGLREALLPDWGAGAYGEILDDGDISIGEQVAWED
jgi:MOSC domain-containing protein YiiM